METKPECYSVGSVVLAHTYTDTQKIIKSYSHKEYTDDELQSIVIRLGLSKRTQYAATKYVEYAIVFGISLPFFFTVYKVIFLSVFISFFFSFFSMEVSFA